MKTLWTVCAWALLLCSAAFGQGSGSETHLGGCILLTPGAEAPDDLYYDTGVIRTDEFKPLTKTISVYGIILAGNDDVTDEFMRDVATAIKEIFPRDRGLDGQQQQQLLTNLHRYRALIPMFEQQKGFRNTPEEEEAWRTTEAECSVCDVIFKTNRGQVMEVVEHILHYVSTVGLHYTFPEEWGVSDTSKINQFMREAIDRKFYDVGGYTEIEDEKERQRVEIQEFSYWVISTAWNLQEPYGGGGGEWTIKNRVELKEQMPELFAMVEQTVGTIMVPPSLKILDKFPDSPKSDGSGE